MSRVGEAWRALTRRDANLSALAAANDARHGGGMRGAVRVTDESALRHSAVWACLRLRANLISTMPVDVFRKVGDLSVEVTKPALLTQPAPDTDITEWLWSSQYDLDRYGNAFGIITATDAAGRPAQVELVAAADCSVRTKGRAVESYTLAGEKFSGDRLRYVWHERQYRPAGSPLGLSPIAYAAWSIGGYLSAQEFALHWYGHGANPKGTLRNRERAVSMSVMTAAKAQFKAATEDGDIFVTGSDWEWLPAQGDANSAAFIDEMQYGITDVCRFLDVPADMIDAPSRGSAITYANITQRNVQLLVTSLGPAVFRRERKLSGAIAGPRFVKLNSDAVLRMDPETRARVLALQVDKRALLPSEWRALEDRPAYTEEQFAEFDRLFGAPRQAVEAQAQVQPPAERAGWSSTGWALPDGPQVEVTGVTSARGHAALAIESGRQT